MRGGSEAFQRSRCLVPVDNFYERAGPPTLLPKYSAREDADFHRIYLAVSALGPGRGDVVTDLDIGSALFHQSDDGNIGGELYCQRLAAPRFAWALKHNN